MSRIGGRLLLAMVAFVCLPAAVRAQAPMDIVELPALARNRVFQRWWFAFQQRAYPLGYVPAGAKVRALGEIARWRAATPFPRAPVTGNGFVPIGPAPIQGGQVGMTGNARPVSGRVKAIAVDPTDATHWLIGAAQGGVWETRDSGTTWTPRTDAQASLAMGAVAFAPSNPSIIFAGTGEVAFSVDSYAGAGLLKSTDGGATWTLLAAGTFANAGFSDLKVDPIDPTILVAATGYGFAGRGGDFHIPSGGRGIYKSTNGGSSWMQRLVGDGTDIEVDPTNFSNQYAGLGDPFGYSGNGVYRSTDAGTTWALIGGPWSSAAGGIGRVELAIAPSNPNVLYVSIQDAIDGVGVDNGLLGLWRTANAWAPTPTWTTISVTATDNGSGTLGYCGWDLAFSSASSQCSWDHDIIVDPTNANVLYAGGIPLWKLDGTTWTEVSKTASSPTNGIHADQHVLAWAGTRLVVGNDGGVWSTTNGGSTWNQHNTLQITQFYYGSVHPTNANFALGASQDNGTARWTGTDAWQWIFSGDGAGNFIAATDPNNRWAVSAQKLTPIARTTNGGGSYTQADGGIDKTGVPFIAALVKCPANDDVVLAPTDNLWRTSNFFSSAPGAPTWSANGPEMAKTVSAMAFAPSDGTCMTYAFGTGFDSTFTTAGDLRLTVNGGGSWTNIDAGGAVPARYVTGLAFDPTNANVLYVTLSGFDEATPGRPGHVFKTTNALVGAPSWSNVSPPVNIPHNAVAVEPDNPNIVWVGTDLGVWTSTNGGGSWTHLGPAEGMPNVAVFDVQLSDPANRLLAFTHGRGAFELSTVTTTTSTTTTLPSPAQNKCTAAKLKAIAKKESGKLACRAKSAAKADPSLTPACDAKVEDKYAAAFAKAVGCAGDQSTCESIANDGVNKVAAALPDTGKCEAAKLKAAGKKASGRLGCYSKAAATGQAVDSAPGGCLDKAQAKFAAAFAKAESSGACTGSQSTVENLVDSECVGDLVVTDSGGMVTGICP